MSHHFNDWYSELGRNRFEQLGDIIINNFDEEFRTEFSKFRLFLDTEYRLEFLVEAQKCGLDGEKIIELFCQNISGNEISKMFPDENGEPIDFSSFFEITNEAMLADLYLTCLSTNAVEQIPDTLKESFNKIVKQIEDYLEQYIEEEMECDEYEKELDYMRRHIS